MTKTTSEATKKSAQIRVFAQANPCHPRAISQSKSSKSQKQKKIPNPNKNWNLEFSNCNLKTFYGFKIKTEGVLFNHVL